MSLPDPRVILVQAMGFVLVLLVFKLYLFKPILGILDTRRKEIDSEYGDAEDQRKAADELRAQYEQHLASASEEMRAKIAEAVKEGQAMREEIIADSRTQADRILSKAQEEIGREKDKALVELKSVVAGLAVDAAGKLIEEKLDPAKHHRLISKVIDDLDGAAK